MEGCIMDTSMDIALYPSNPDYYHAPVRHAGTAIYAAKYGGKNQYRGYPAGLAEAEKARPHFHAFTPLSMKEA